MDKQEARDLLEVFVEDLRQKPYEELAQLIRNPDCVEVSGASGVSYQIEYEALWDNNPGGLLRVIASIDDGGLLTAMFPITISFLMNSAGQLMD